MGPDAWTTDTLLDRGGQAQTAVTTYATAIALRSGDLPVLATPRLVALMEEAACAAIDGLLPPGTTTVGTRMDIEHLAPSPLGAIVTAHARVVSTSGARIEFEVTAQHARGDEVRDIGRGTHTRVAVDRAAFLARLDP